MKDHKPQGFYQSNVEDQRMDKVRRHRELSGDCECCPYDVLDPDVDFYQCMVLSGDASIDYAPCLTVI